MESIEGNKIIAEFMGYRVFDKRYPRNHGIGAPEAEWKDMIIQKAKYHSSWDWLMPVVEKIRKMKDKTVSINCNEMGCCCMIKGDHTIPAGWDIILSNVQADSALEATWPAIIKFIQWLSSNTKQK